MASKEFVRARVEGLLAQPVDDELVVYDPDTEQAHVLNPVAFAVWENARAGATIEQLCAVLADTDEAAIRLAIADLAQVGLLLDAPDDSVLGGMSRRALLKRIGIAAIAVPFVTTIASASPAAAAGEACSASGTCVGGTCDTGTNTCYRPCTVDSQCTNVSGCGCDETTGRCRKGSGNPGQEYC